MDGPVVMDADDLSYIGACWHEFKRAVAVNGFFPPRGISHVIDLMTNDEEPLSVPCTGKTIRTDSGFHSLVRL
jgi:hypothetical protein